MWSVLAECFGNTLVSSYGETCPPLWCARIDELEDWEIKRGLDRLSKANSAFAPTLGQFWDACKQSDARPQPVDDQAALKRIGHQPGSRSPVASQRERDIEAGRWPYIDGVYISPGSLAPKHWEQYQAGDYPNAAKHRAYCDAHPAEYREWMDYRARHWGNRYGFEADGVRRVA